MANDIYFGDRNKRPNSRHDKPLTEAKPSPFVERFETDASVSEEHGGQRHSEKTPPKRKNKRKKKSGGRIFLSAVSVLLAAVLLLCIGAAAAAGYMLKDYSALPFEDSGYVQASAAVKNSGIYNILMMGIDTLDTNADTRSDAMILLSVDPEGKKLKLTSFMRDSYVEIPGHGFAKLNAACVYGGPQLVVDTIEYNFGVKIDAYAKIGYDVFVELVDGIGGITIPEIDETEAAALAYEGFDAPVGKDIELNGQQALLYCRIRKGQSDFNRTARQREAITLIVKKAMKTNPAKLISLAKSIVGKMQCSIDKSQFYSLAIKAVPCLFSDIEQARVPADGTWYNDSRNSQAVLIVDFEQNKEYIQNFIYE